MIIIRPSKKKKSCDDTVVECTLDVRAQSKDSAVTDKAVIAVQGLFELGEWRIESICESRYELLFLQFRW
jgi:hypothetical protein